MKTLLRALLIVAALLACGAGAHAQCTGFFFSTVYGEVETCTAGAQVSQGQILGTNTSVPTQVIPMVAGATGGYFGVALQSASVGGSVLVLINGQGQVSIDNACVFGEAIVMSPTNTGQGHCAVPGSTQYVGIALGTLSAAGSVWAQVSALSSGYLGGSGGGGGGGTTQTIASGTATMGTSTIGSGACATVVSVTATGVLTTDTFQADFNADPTSTTGYNPSTGMLTIVKYPTSGNVNFKVCNNTGSSITPSAVTLNWRVVRYVSSGGNTTSIASGTATLGTSTIGSGACATAVTVTATGVLTTDDIQADFNADPTSTTGYNPSLGMLTIVKYPTSGNVNFKVCNNTGSSITPSAVTLNWSVVR
jgi:hypothetical protein